MSTWITNYTPLIFQVYGLSFFAMGIAAFVFPKRDNILTFSEHMVWLAAFGLLHGSQEFIDGARLQYASHALTILSNLLMLLSFTALFEFGRRIWNDANNLRKLSAMSVYPVIFIVITWLTISMDDPLTGLELGAHFFIAAPGAFLAGWSLLKTHRTSVRSGDRERILTCLPYAAIALLVYGALTLVISNQHAQLPWWIPTNTNFISMTGLPVQIFRALCAVVAAATLIILIKRAGKRSEESAQLASIVFSHAREGITITDATGSIIEVNDTFSRITGYSREEVIGKNPRILQSGRQSAEFYKDMWASIKNKGYWYGEVWNRRKNGEVYAQMLTISAARDTDGTALHYISIFSDITQIKEQQEQLEHIAHYDALTNLPNRLLLADRLKNAIRQSDRRKQKIGLVYLDLDGFKAVNDTHGHNIGDELLITVSQRMKAALRDGDTLSRIGGDEFVAILVDLDQTSDAIPVLDRLLQAADAPIVIRDITLNVSASIGVAIYPEHSKDADQLMRNADQAMYTAKKSGKNRYHFFDSP